MSEVEGWKGVSSHCGRRTGAGLWPWVCKPHRGRCKLGVDGGVTKGADARRSEEMKPRWSDGTLTQVLRLDTHVAMRI